MTTKQTIEANLVPNKSLLELGEVSILLSSYNDIFSDFDPSSYSERTLSDDFIAQAKKFSKDKGNNKMALKLLIPTLSRNELEEKVIIKRLHSHFKEIYLQLLDDRKKINIRGIILTAVGLFFMTVASYLSFMKPEKYHTHFLLVLFEPGGWFLVWSGLDHLVYLSKSTKKDIDFYDKMIKSDIKFLTY